MDDLKKRLREQIVIGYHDDGYAMIGHDKDGNTVSKSRPSTPMTRPANRDGPEAADRIEKLEAENEQLRGLENFVSCAESDVTMEMARQLFDLTDHSSKSRATLSDSSAK